MSIRLLTIVVSGACLFCSCQKSSKQDTNVVTVVEDTMNRPHAVLSVPNPINLGVFQGDELKKIATIAISNAGNDTLYIIGAEPDCLCTEVQVLDSVIAPHHSGRMQVALDLTEYPRDTIYKDIAIISNDSKDHVKRIQLMGIRK